MHRAVALVLMGCGGGAAVADPSPPPLTSSNDRSLTHAAVVEARPVHPAPVAVPFPVPDWSTASPEAHGLSSERLDLAAEVAASKKSYCLLVIRNGALVYEKYFNGKGPNDAHPSWSIAKSYSSTLVGIAIDRGDIKGLDQSVADFVSEWRGTDRATITIRDLVSMTSGLKWDAFNDYVVLATLSRDNTKDAIGHALDKPPGTRWNYDNGAVQVLERVFRTATGGTVEEYASKHLWSKIGSRATWKHDPSGNPTTYANVLATCRDHARLGYLYLHKGQWAGEQVISEDYVTRALTPSQPFNRAYGYLFWLNGETPAIDAMGGKWTDRMVPFAPKDLFAARGFGNQFIDVIPSRDMIVVRFGQDPGVSSLDLSALMVDAKFEVHDQLLKPVLEAITE